MRKYNYKHGLLALLVLATTACEAGGDEIYLSYDTSHSADPGDSFIGNDDGYPKIDSCALSGEKFSVFIAKLAEAPNPQRWVDYCPDPPYDTNWAEAKAERVKHAVGNEATRDLQLMFLVDTGVDYYEMSAGEQLLVAARRYEPDDVWVVLEAIGVTLTDDVAATTNTGSRMVDLPSSWNALVTELENDRGADCGFKLPTGRTGDAAFADNMLLGDLDDECAATMP